MALPDYEIEELGGFPKFRGSQNEISSTRVVKINWSDIDNHYISLFPPPILGFPQFPAYCPGSSALFADTVEYEPFFDEAAIVSNGPPNQYDYAKATINYKTIPYEMSDGEQIITRKVAVKAEAQQLPNRPLKWVSDGAAVQDETTHAAKVVNMVEFNITLHRVPNPSWSTYMALLGMVNNATYDSNSSIAAGCLLFAGFEGTQVVTTDASQPWNLEMKLVARYVDGNSALGWNYFLRPSSGNWEQLQTSDGNPIYYSGDFSGLY